LKIDPVACLPEFSGVVVFQRRHLDLGTQRRLRKRDRYHAVKVLAFALEEGMFLGMQHDVEIAGRATKTPASPSPSTGCARLPRHLPELSPSRHARGDASLAAAGGAGIDDQPARSPAGAAGAGDREEALLIAHLSATAAGVQLMGALPGQRRFPCRARTLPAGALDCWVTPRPLPRIRARDLRADRRRVARGYGASALAANYRRRCRRRYLESR